MGCEATRRERTGVKQNKHSSTTLHRLPFNIKPASQDKPPTAPNRRVDNPPRRRGPVNHSIRHPVTHSCSLRFNELAHANVNPA
jgi:hypothetical protein